MILECSGVGEDMEIIKKATGNVADSISQPLENADIKAVIDPEARVIGLRLYDGFFTIIPLEKANPELKASSIRMDEQLVINVDFLHGCANPTVVIIHQDIDDRRVKTHEISLRDKKFVKELWKESVERETRMVIGVPSPTCGAIFIGQESILYHDHGPSWVAIVPPILKYSPITCYAKIDAQGLRYLLGDMAGNLFILCLEQERKPDGTTVIKDLKFEFLGEVSIPECITYFDNDVVFVESRLGDSQLIKLLTKPDQYGSYCVEIVDKAVVDLEGEMVKFSSLKSATKGGNRFNSIMSLFMVYLRTVVTRFSQFFLRMFR
ncbi:DNA damage-binding protein 1-like [Aphidius gifuensis]|uniref:DNA damage-binding protein 1-like n=1 Tax=Aphidius gifuensis TaxID=684658 RepID=UPI001CDCB01E|nr:DNA damage-binding protein 1-like [Aphidius gifuensis]